MFNLVNKKSIKASAMIALAIAGNSLVIEAVKANESENNQLTLEQIQGYDQNQSMDQVTSVSQLRDVSPTDWAYEALRSLVERYGCIVGYPDRTFRGNRALSRYEFAAGLNACMQQMERLIAGSESVLREDVAKLQRLITEFEAELAALGARVDNIEGRVAFLEDNQFSTTTKLSGEVILAVAAGWSDDQDDAQTTLSDRVRLTLDTSFTGNDRLRTRLAAGNIAEIQDPLGTNMARLNFLQFTGLSGNDVELDRLYYRTSVGDNTTVWVGTILPPQDIYETFSPYTQSSGTGALSRFGRYNPFIYRSVAGAGGGLKFDFNDTFNITASYLAGNANNPNDGNGLFDGTYSAGVQLGISPTDTIDLGLSYMRSYFTPGDVNVSGSLTSGESRRPFGNSVPTTTDNFGVQASWKVASRLHVGGWFGYSFAEAQENINGDDDAELLSWSANVSFLRFT